MPYSDITWLSWGTESFGGTFHDLLATRLSTAVVGRLPRSPLQSEGEIAAIGLLALTVGGILMYLGIKRFQTGRLIKNTPPEKVRSVAIGRTELHGDARDAGVTFDQPFTDGKCLFFSYQIAQYEEKQVHDDDGGTDTERTWNTTSSQSLAAPFNLDDGTGEILVVSNAGANFQISDENSFTETFDGHSIPGKYKKNVDTSVDIAEAVPEDVDWDPHNLTTKIDAKIPYFSLPGTSADVNPSNSGSPQQPDYSTESTRGQILKRRISQTVLPLDEEVHVYGAATMREETTNISNENRLIVQGDEDTGRFIVSDQGEESLAQTYTRWGLAFIALGLAIMAFGVWYLADNLAAVALVVGLRQFRPWRR